MTKLAELRAKAKDARIFFFDIDGTVVRFKADRMSDQVKADLHALRERGYKVYIASGRHPAMMNNVQDFAFDGYMGLNGQYCVRGAYDAPEPDVLRSEPLHQDDIHALIDYLATPQAKESIMFITAEGPYINRSDAHAEEVGDMLKLKPWILRDPQTFQDVKVYQLLYFGPEEEEHRIMSRMPHATSTRWHPSFIDIIPRDGGKHEGLRAICEAEGIAVEDSIAFGDGDNDLTMLEAAGLGIAMGNATAPVQSIADYITRSVDEEGIAHALRELEILES